MFSKEVDTMLMCVIKMKRDLSFYFVFVPF